MTRPPLRDWRDELMKITGGCPYVGPRPQTSKDTNMLIGRERDVASITRKVLDHRLVIIDGSSGSGKTSLLRNGLIEMLKEPCGFNVLICREWKHAASFDRGDSIRQQVERYLAACIDLTYQNAALDVPGEIDLAALAKGGGLSDALGDLSGATVLVLDQFEELLRRPGNIPESVVEWIVARTFDRTPHLVVSLRTDSRHLLDAKLRGIRPFAMSRHTVEELSDATTIKSIITTMHPDSRVKSPPDTAADELRDLWYEAQDPTILGLQATLHALYFGRVDGAREKDVAFDSSDITQLKSMTTGGLPPGDRPSDLFVLGLHRSIDLRIKHAERACEDAGLDVYLKEGAREIVRRAVSLLSSGDFKVPINGSELAIRTLEQEWRILESDIRRECRDAINQCEGCTSEQKERANSVASSQKHLTRMLFEGLRKAEPPEAEPGTVRSLLTVRLHELKFESLPALSFPEPGRPGGDGPARARLEVTAGPMMSLTATETLLEEVRRVAFAIEWLSETQIVKRDPEGTVLLVHDGSGSALNTWADANPPGSGQALNRLTGARGEQYDWLPPRPAAIDANAEAPVEARDGWIGPDPSKSESFKMVANLNWRDCRVSAKFWRVVFANCDFSGSRFVECTFEGVTFVNCLLDDANFENCTISRTAELSSGLGLDVKEATDEPGEGVEDFEDRTVSKTAEPSQVLEKDAKKAEKVRLAPSFTVEAREEDIRSFGAYLELSKPKLDSLQFFSDTSGTPARPGPCPSGFSGRYLAHFEMTESPDLARKPAQVKPAEGGVAMFGGRLCFLTLYKCASSDSGSFAFHHVSGDGLYIVEQDGVGVDVHDGNLRGISVSRDKESSLYLGGSGAVKPIKLKIKHSFLQNLYFGDGLDGEATFTDCQVLMLMNAGKASRDGFKVTLEDCRFQCVVNVHMGSPVSAEDSSSTTPRLHDNNRYFEREPDSDYESQFAFKNPAVLASNLMAMDYRYRPEIWEHKQRQRKPEPQDPTEDSA